MNFLSFARFDFCFFLLNFYKFVFQLYLFLVLKWSWDFAFNSEDQLETSRKFNIRFFWGLPENLRRINKKNIVQMFDLGRWTRPRLSLLKVAKSEKFVFEFVFKIWTNSVSVSIFCLCKWCNLAHINFVHFWDDWKYLWRFSCF